MLYVDLTCCFLIKQNFGIYSGGTNYAIEIIKQLHKKIDFIVIVPSGHELKEVDPGNKLDKNYINIIKCECLRCFRFKNNDILFLPAVFGKNMLELKYIKQNNPKLKIYGTLHDRQHNYYKFDKYDLYYYPSISEKINCYLQYYIKRYIFNIMYGYWIKYFDKIFTVSNYSMQKLMHCKIKEIKFFTQINQFSDYSCNGLRGNYMLLVGAGRPEKNLLRTLEAFCEYKKLNGKLNFIVTGVNEKIKDKLLSFPKIDKSIVDRYVCIYPYLSKEKLKDLYANSRYVLFLSKGEGYGLPVVEALSNGKAVIASRTTSIPEVAGASIEYVDPFSVNSIVNKMIAYDNDEYLDLIEANIRERYRIIQELSLQDMNIFIQELTLEK